MTIHRKKDADSILFNGLFFRHDFMNIFCKCMRKMKEKKNLHCMRICDKNEKIEVISVKKAKAYKKRTIY